jgi:hypothetical protein
MSTNDTRTVRTLCLCGHRWDWHNGLGLQPCGACECEQFEQIDTPAPAEAELEVMAKDLFGEMRAFPKKRVKE